MTSIPLELNFVRALSLVGGGLGVTCLRREGYAQETQYQQGEDPDSDGGGATHTGFDFGTHRDQEPGPMAEIVVASVHGTSILCEQGEGTCGTRQNSNC
jgi:hypothetical protein